MFFITDYCLMQVKSIAECSKGSILQYFRASLSYNFPLRPLFCLFLSGRLRQVLLYFVKSTYKEIPYILGKVRWNHIHSYNVIFVTIVALRKVRWKHILGDTIHSFFVKSTYKEIPYILRKVRWNHKHSYNLIFVTSAALRKFIEST